MPGESSRGVTARHGGVRSAARDHVLDRIDNARIPAARDLHHGRRLRRVSTRNAPSFIAGSVARAIVAPPGCAGLSRQIDPRKGLVETPAGMREGAVDGDGAAEHDFGRH